MDEVIKAMAQAIEELGNQTLTNRVAGVIAVENQLPVTLSSGAPICCA